MQAGFFLKKIRAARSFCTKTRKFTAYACSEAQGASLIICHDTSSAIPAAIAAAKVRAPIALDVSEIPDLQERTSDYFRLLPAVLPRLLHVADRWVGRRSVLITASSSAFCRYASMRYNRPALQVTNYEGGSPNTSGGRQQGGPVVVVWPSTFSRQTGAELALKALSIAPDDWRLDVCDDEPDLRGDAALESMLAACRPRIRFLGRKPYAEYVAQLRNSTVGWVLFDGRSQNLRACLPNRFLDLIAAGVPVVATPNESILPILSDKKWGTCIAYGDVGALLQATQEAAGGTDFFQPTPQEFQASAGAVSFEEAYACLAARPAIEARPLAVIVAMRNLAGRRRISLLAYALVRLGWRVAIVCRRVGPDIEIDRSEASYIQVRPHFL